jgi:hypothetical protein
MRLRPRRRAMLLNRSVLGEGALMILKMFLCFLDFKINVNRNAVLQKKWMEIATFFPIAAGEKWYSKAARKCSKVKGPLGNAKRLLESPDKPYTRWAKQNCPAAVGKNLAISNYFL